MSSSSRRLSFNFYILFNVLIIFLISIIHDSAAQIRQPNHAVVDEKRRHIDVDSTWLDKKDKKVQRVGLDASEPDRVLLDLLTEKKQLSASATGNIAAAETSEGQRAQVQKFGSSGGVAQAAGHK